MEICIDDSGNVHIYDGDNYHSLSIDKHNNPIFDKEEGEPNIIADKPAKKFMIYRDKYQTDEENEQYEIVYDYKEKYDELELYNPGMEFCLFSTHSDSYNIDILLRDNPVALYNSKIYDKGKLIIETEIYPEANLYTISLDTTGKLTVKILNDTPKVYHFGWDDNDLE